MSDYKTSEMIEGEDVLLWPPGPANRRNPIPPQPNWIRHQCTILKRNIATFEEAIRLEKIYSKHDDSNSFRAAEAKKQLKRAHPVNENSIIKSGLIDLNPVINKINGSVSQAKIPKKIGNPDVENVNTRSQPRNQYHDQCHEKNKTKMRSGTSSSIKNVKAGTNKKSIPPLRKVVMPENSNDKEEVKKSGKPVPRYKNYLKSGTNNGQRNKSVPVKKASVSATITKGQFLAQNGFYENDFQKQFSSADSDSPHHSGVPVSQNLDQFQIDNAAELSNRLPATSNENADDIRRKPQAANVVDNILLHPSMNSTPISTDFSFQSTVVKCLDDIKQFCMHAEVKRVHFEARMQTQWDLFVRKMSQGGGIGGQNEPPIEDEDDFEDLDEQFPKKTKEEAEELEMNIRRDFVLKRRLSSRMDLIGGGDPDAAVRFRMKYLFVDKVLDKYTWRGTEKLDAFRGFKSLNNLLYNNVRSNFPKVKYRKDKYGKYMVQWLKHSTTRQRTVVYTYPDRSPQGEISDELDENEDKDENQLEEYEDDFP